MFIYYSESLGKVVILWAFIWANGESNHPQKQHCGKVAPYNEMRNLECRPIEWRTTSRRQTVFMAIRTGAGRAAVPEQLDQVLGNQSGSR